MGTARLGFFRVAGSALRLLCECKLFWSDGSVLRVVRCYGSRFGEVRASEASEVSRSAVVGLAGKAWLDKVTKQCPDVKWIAHYALLGQYDFMDIYQAPDAKTAHQVSYISRAEGAVEAESWHALAYDEYLKLTQG